MTRATAFRAMAAILTAAPLTAQPESREDSRAGFRFALSVNAVHLAVTVSNKKGRLVTNLKEEDFRILEDGVPQEIRFFSRSVDSPVDVLLLVDASGSMEMVSKVVNARSAAAQLIHSLAPEDRVALYAFDRNLIQLTPFSANKSEATQALAALDPFGSTALYDSVAKAAAAIAHEGFGRRAIVVITDGVDTSSRLSLEEAVEAAKGVDLPVYIIRVVSSLDDPSSDSFLHVHGHGATGPDALDRFASETGGRLYQGSQLGPLRLASMRIWKELKTQYRLAYVPRNSNNDGSFRRIVVKTRRRGTEARTRTGYFARKHRSSLGGSPNLTPQH
ncbi:MAG: VWA domain-containing protein [Acidobacteriota bacterium]